MVGDMRQPPEDWQRLADHVRAARRDAGFPTRRALAAATGITDRTLGKLERGERVGTETLAAVARAVGWPPEGPRRVLAGRTVHGEPAAADRPRPQLAEVPHAGMEPALLERLLRQLVEASGPRGGEPPPSREALERRREVLELIMESQRDLPRKAELILDILHDDPSLPADWDKPADGHARRALTSPLGIP